MARIRCKFQDYRRIMSKTIIFKKLLNRGIK